MNQVRNIYPQQYNTAMNPQVLGQEPQTSGASSDGSTNAGLGLLMSLLGPSHAAKQAAQDIGVPNAAQAYQPRQSTSEQLIRSLMALFGRQ